MITNHLKDVCKIGQRESTCRHLFAGTSGFECGKLDPQLKELQDARAYADLVLAKGDNCDGVTKEADGFALLNDVDFIKKKLNEGQQESI
jgi:hypothetical protein